MTTLRIRDIRNILKATYPCENGTIELINVSFIADEPTLFGEVNDYTKRELEWYQSGSLNINDIHGDIPKIWQDVADKDGFINSNYGWCIFSEENHYQYVNALAALMKDPYSRQAIMIYTRPNMHEDSTKNGMHDFMCTNTVQLLIRNNKLHYIVQMRSNDAVFGYKNDKFWHDHVFDLALESLKGFTGIVGLEKGNMYWNVGSLHVYPRHFHLLNNHILTNDN